MAQGTVSCLNTDFTERILRLAESDSTIDVIDIFTNQATNKGDNYTSDLMRVVVEFTRKQGNTRVTEKKSLIFKFEPILEGIRKETIVKSQIFDTEIAMMTNTLQKMNDILGSRLGARVFYVRMERPLCLIMEDLAPLGFRMADRQVGLDLAHCRLAVQGLAKFHASSVALCEKEPIHKSLYWRGIFHDECPELIQSYFNLACIALATEAENWPQVKRLADKIRKLGPITLDLAREAVRRKDDEFNVINHGDCWVNNMLFRYDKQSRPVELIFVDFQLCLYTSPAVDLHYFLSTSVSEQIYETSINDLLDEYLQSLTGYMEELGCKTPPPTMEELNKTLKEREVYAFISSMNTLPMALLDKNEVKDLDEIFQADKVDNPGYRNPIYQRIMTKRLLRYDELGLLDP